MKHILSFTTGFVSGIIFILITIAVVTHLAISGSSKFNSSSQYLEKTELVR